MKMRIVVSFLSIFQH